MAQKRIYQIAKELNISHVEIIKFLKSKDIEVANHMAPVDNNIYDSILMEFSKEKASIDRQRKERARKEIVSNKEDVVESKPDLFGNRPTEVKEDKKTDKEPVKEEEVKKEEDKPIDKSKNEESLDKETEGSTELNSDSKSPQKPPKRKLKKIAGVLRHLNG